MHMRIAHFVAETQVDGPGTRTSVYVKGCPIRCRGCQSPQLFEQEGGIIMSVKDVAAGLIAHDLPVTILGGEPMAQPEALAELVVRLKWAGRNVMVYSGYTLEQLREMTQRTPEIRTVLEWADTLVDGPFIIEDDDPFVQWRGSRNQRPIDLALMRYEGLDIMQDEPLLHNWDEELELTIDDYGLVLGPEGLIDLLLLDGDEAKQARRCGQTRGITLHV